MSQQNNIYAFGIDGKGVPITGAELSFLIKPTIHQYLAVINLKQIA